MTKAKLLLKYFPELRNKDEYLTEFTLNGHSAFEPNKPLDPANFRYKRPDFGFNDYLNVTDDDNQDRVSHWSMFKDCFMKDTYVHERVKNFVEFIHRKKIRDLKYRLHLEIM